MQNVNKSTLMQISDDLAYVDLLQSLHNAEKEPVLNAALQVATAYKLGMGWEIIYKMLHILTLRIENVTCTADSTDAGSECQNDAKRGQTALPTA